MKNIFNFTIKNSSSSQQLYRPLRACLQFLLQVDLSSVSPPPPSQTPTSSRLLSRSCFHVISAFHAACVHQGCYLAPSSCNTNILLTLFLQKNYYLLLKKQKCIIMINKIIQLLNKFNSYCFIQFILFILNRLHICCQRSFF